ncbi:MAG: hypothetical protein J6W76_04450, partial [Spirochaetales bacterium]|nr:hypothetical protein [Spirochaetales bacterium]
MNIYAFLLLFCGIAAAFVPFYKVTLWLIIPQVIFCLFCIKKAVQLFSTWKDKQVKYDILIRRNKNEFHP